MSILWCGGEDIDFPNGVVPTVETTSSYFRTGYARAALRNSGGGGHVRSTAMSSPVTSCWLSCRFYGRDNSNTSERFIGLGQSGSEKGLFIGADSSAAFKVALWTYDGTTWTKLATESGTSWPSGGIVNRVDMQLIGPLATATVNIYVNGAFVLTFSGNVAVTGLTGYDSIYLPNNTGGRLTEMIIADEDTRGFPGLVTLALTGAGTTDNWTASTFGNINGTTISDASPMSSNTNAQESMFNITDLPSGSFVIKACKLSARSAKSASPAVTKVQLGWANVSGTSAYTAAAVAVTTAYATYEQLDSVNPVTGVAFVQSEMNALQTSVKSAT